MALKICSSCKIERSVEDFHKNKSSTDGLDHECKFCKSKRGKKHYIKNKDQILKKHKKYNEINKEKTRKVQNLYDKLNSNRLKELKRVYSNNRYKSDINFKLKRILRSRLFDVIKNNRKSGSSVNDLGCSVEFLKLYLETLWLPGMDWNNYGRHKNQWSIDHIFPLSRFNLEDREQFLKACHYTNLQPMWHVDNVRKFNHLPGEDSNV